MFQVRSIPQNYIFLEGKSSNLIAAIEMLRMKQKKKPEKK